MRARKNKPQGKPHKMEYTIREAAELRGVHPKTVRRQIKTGEVKAQLKIDEQLRLAIYIIPHTELKKIKARPAHRPRTVQT